MSAPSGSSRGLISIIGQPKTADKPIVAIRFRVVQKDAAGWPNAADGTARQGAPNSASGCSQAPAQRTEALRCATAPPGSAEPTPVSGGLDLTLRLHPHGNSILI